MVESRLDNFRINTDTGCWEWQGPTSTTGYGRIGNRYAHRVSWENTNGPIPAGQCVLHRCDNPLCLNPQHLFLGSKADNTLDMLRKGRLNTGRRLFSPEEIQVIRDRFENNDTMVRDIAAEYGVHPDTIGRIIQGHTYRWVGAPNVNPRRRWAKLKPEQVVEIRQRFASGESQASLAREFGITTSSMCALINAKTWKHIGGVG